MAGKIISLNNKILANKDHKICCTKPLMANIAGKDYEYVKIGNKLWMVDLLRYEPVTENCVKYGHIEWNDYIPNFIETDTPTNIDTYYYGTNAGYIFNNPEFEAELKAACGDWRLPTDDDISELITNCGGIEHSDLSYEGWDFNSLPFNVYNTGWFCEGGYAGYGIKETQYQSFFITMNSYYVWHDSETGKYRLKVNDFNPKSGLFYIPIKLCKDI